MRKLVAGNWKMNGTRGEAAAWCAAVRAADRSGLASDLLVCPPALLIAEMARLLDGTGVAVGGQDCSARAPGAHTGDLSASMLRDAGATAVILGHSERRADHGESNADVHAKVLAALAAGIRPIVCVGETEAERMAGQAEAVVGRQLAGSVPEGVQVVIAYEPVWAIGTGKTPTEADVVAMQAFIRSRLGVANSASPILYGGSVKPGNAGVLLNLPEVGGALVGGASLVAEDLLGIARQAA